MAESTVAGQGPLLGWNKAQESISALTRTINDLNRGLQGVNSGIGQTSRAYTFGSRLGNAWHGTPSSNGNGGGAQFTNQGSQGGGGSNNGGQGGSGGGSNNGGSNGGGTNTPRLGGGSGNGGHPRYSFKSGVQGLVSWGQGQLGDQVAMQTTAYQAAQYSSQSWHTLRNQAFKNNFTAQSTADAAQAFNLISRTGLSGGTSNFNTQWNYVKGTSGYLNPNMSETQRAQGTAAAWNAGTYNTLRQFGIQTIKGGQKQSPRQIAQQIFAAFPELKRIKTQQQISATLNDPASGLNQSLNSWGLDPNTLELVKGELRGMLLAQTHGASMQAYVSTANQRDSGKNQEAKHSAQSQLGKWGIGDTRANTLMERSGTLRNQDVNINDSFSSGLKTAAGLLNQFSTALQKVLQATGADSVMGWAGGASSLIGGAVGGGLSAYGTMRGLGSIAGLARGGGSGGGFLGSLAAGAAGRGGAGAAGGAGGLMRGAMRGGAYGLAGWGVQAIGDPLVEKYVKDPKKKKWAHAGVSTASGALTGAAIGTMIAPGVGTAVGAVIGGGVGLVSSLWGGAGEGGSSAASATGGKGKSGAVATGTQGAGKTAAAVIRIAMKYVGVPYVWGGSTPKGFDCSGLLQYSFKQIGVSLPRTAAQQQKAGKRVKLNEVRAGDLLFNGNPAHHVVMCIGNGKIIEAPRTGLNVRVRSFKPGEFTNAVRILGAVGNMGDLTNDNSDTAGSDSNRLSTMGFGGDVGAYGSIEEVDAIAAGIAGIGAANVGSGVGDGQGSKKNTDNGSTASGPMPTGNLKSWITKALGIVHMNSKQNQSYVYSMAMHESGGNPRAQNNWDSNAKAGHPSKGLLQTIDSTFSHYSIAGHKNIWNPVDNIIAGVRYAVSRYGSLGNVPGIKSMANGGGYKGYAVGSTNIDVDQTARVHKGEMIIPAHQADTIRKALASNTPLTGGIGGLHTKGTSPTLNFHAGSVVVQVQGVMDSQSARDAAQKLIQALAEDNRINLIAAGN